MINYSELAREAADTVRPSPGEEVLREVRRRRVRRRRAVGAVAGIAALALVSTGGYAYLNRPNDHVSPSKDTQGAVALPTDRAVGAGTRLDRKCGSHTCLPLLTTKDGRRYTLPGPKTDKDHVFSTGVSLSPDGHWVAYNRAGRVEVRDLTGTRTWRVKGSGDLGAPTAWSANNRWLLVQPAWKAGGNAMRQSQKVIRLDLRGGHQTAGVDLATLLHAGRPDGAVAVPAVLPDGNIAFPVAGDKPAGKPASGKFVVGPGSYPVVDPVSRRKVDTISIDRITPWGSMSPGEWSREGPAVLNVNRGMTRAVVSLTGMSGPQGSFALVDLTSHEEDTVDVSPVLHGTIRGAAYWEVGTVTDDTITFIASDSDGKVLGTATTDASAARVLSVHRVDHPTATTMLPGMPGSI